MKIWHVYAGAPLIWLSNFIFLKLLQDSQPLLGATVCTTIAYCILTWAIFKKPV